MQSLEAKMIMFTSVLFILTLASGEGTNDIKSLVDTLKDEGSKLSTGIEKLANQCGAKEQNTDVLTAIQKTMDLQVIKFSNNIMKHKEAILAKSF